MRRGILLLVFCNVVGGLTYSWQKTALAGLPPATMTCLRSLVGIALMALLLVARREPLWPFERRETGRLALLGSLGLAAPLLLGAEGVRLSTAANASILILLEPPSVVFFAWLLLRERVGARRSLGIGLGLAGALAVVTEGATNGVTLFRGEHFLGNVLLAASGILWGLYSPLTKPLVERRSAVATTMGAMVFAVLLFLPFVAVELSAWRPGPEFGRALTHTLLLGVVASFLGTVLWTFALRDLPAAAVAPLILIQPVVGAAAGMISHGERVSLQAAVGGALVAVGALVAETGSAKPEQSLSK